MPEINIRYVTDDKDNAYYPITHIDAVEGFDLLEFEDMTNIREDLDNVWDQSSNTSEQVTNLQNQLNTLTSTINGLVQDSGWQNIELLNGAIPYASNSVPKARLVSVNGVFFLSLKGAIKGITETNIDIAKIPLSMSTLVKETKPFAQNMSVSGDIAQFTRMSLKTDGVLKIDRATSNTITGSTGFPIDTTIML